MKQTLDEFNAYRFFLDSS